MTALEALDALTLILQLLAAAVAGVVLGVVLSAIVLYFLTRDK